MRILVTGGAGYIGSHVVRALTSAGHQAVVLDDLREGHRSAIGPETEFVQGDIADSGPIDDASVRGDIDGVIHMAASCQVGESMEKPGKYYENNVTRTLRLLENLHTRGINRFVFSSTAAVYGDPVTSSGEDTAITEEAPTRPTNVYGETKLAIERALDWYARCTDFGAVALRYFNAAGADPAGDIGEDHDPETHLIPLICKAIQGKVPELTVMGRDYPTPDGTCLRDYIHVGDLATAHVLALQKLAEGVASREDGLRVYNLGAESGLSVLEVMETARKVIGREVPSRDGPRRPGDPPILRASSGRIRNELGWKPALSDLETIIETAWRWHSSRPEGYGG